MNEGIELKQLTCIFLSRSYFYFEGLLLPIFRGGVRCICLKPLRTLLEILNLVYKKKSLNECYSIFIMIIVMLKLLKQIMQLYVNQMECFTIQLK
jgi:hypothetical protein